MTAAATFTEDQAVTRTFADGRTRPAVITYVHRDEAGVAFSADIKYTDGLKPKTAVSASVGYGRRPAQIFPA